MNKLLLRQKHILLLVAILLVQSCALNTSSNGGKIEMDNSPDSAQLSKLEEEIKPRDLFHRDEITHELYLVFDTLSNENICNWKNITYRDIKSILIQPSYDQRIDLKVLYAQNIYDSKGKGEVPLYPIRANRIILPMRCEEETTVYTIWEVMKNDSIKFLNAVTPVINTKYAYSYVVGHYEFENKLFLINTLVGGEGGSNFAAIWISEFNKKDRMTTISETEIVFAHDDGDWATIDFSIKDGVVEIFEKREVMELKEMEWVRISSKINTLKKIDLKSYE